jgi:hypothetical protein
MLSRGIIQNTINVFPPRYIQRSLLLVVMHLIRLDSNKSPWMNMMQIFTIFPTLAIAAKA